MKTLQQELNLDLDFTTQNEDMVHPAIRIVRAITVALMIAGYFVVMLPFYPILL